MNKTDFNKALRWLGVAGMLIFSALDAQEYEEEATRADESHVHIHFSSQEFNIYEAKEDAVYQDADWPSRVEEYSDYLSK